MKFPEKLYPFAILFVCIILFLPHLGILPVNIMEARNFITAREMLHDQHWILTTMNAEPRYEKPPLPTWITALSGAVFGLMNTGPLRLPAVLMAVLLASTFYYFGKKISNNARYALNSTLILMTSFYILWAGRNGQWDIFTHAFMMGAIYQIYRLFTSENHRIGHALMAGLFLGFSFMSKGPVSLYALFLPFLIAWGWVYRFGASAKPNLRKLSLPIVLLVLVSLIISSWWYVYIYLFDTHEAQAITTKEVANWQSYQVKPFYYYWSFFIQSGVWTIAAFVSLLYPYLRKRVPNLKLYRFTLLWTLASVVLLSIVPEKKARYLLPVLIPLALNTGCYMEYLFRRFGPKMNSMEKIPVWGQFGLVGTLGIILPFAGYAVLQEHLTGYWLWFILLAIALPILGLLIFRALLKGQIDRGFYLTIAFMGTIVLFGFPLSDAMAVNPQYKGLSELHKWEDSTRLPVYEFKEASPELIWDYGAPLPVLYSQDTFSVPDQNKFGLLAFDILEEEVHTVFKDFHIKKIGHFDMNPRGPTQSGYNGRLYRDFYLISAQ